MCLDYTVCIYSNYTDECLLAALHDTCWDPCWYNIVNTSVDHWGLFCCVLSFFNRFSLFHASCLCVWCSDIQTGNTVDQRKIHLQGYKYKKKLICHFQGFFVLINYSSILILRSISCQPDHKSLSSPGAFMSFPEQATETKRNACSGADIGAVPLSVTLARRQTPKTWMWVQDLAQ